MHCFRFLAGFRMEKVVKWLVPGLNVLHNVLDT